MMREIFDPLLLPLQDVQGVEGSFALLRTGALAARNMPGMFNDETLTSIGLRVTMLFETVDEHLETSDEYFMAYETHQVILRRNEKFILAVLCRPNTNQIGLKMASNIVMRRLREKMEQASSPSTPAPVSGTPIAAAPVTPSQFMPQRAVPQPPAPPVAPAPGKGPFAPPPGAPPFPPGGAPPYPPQMQPPPPPPPPKKKGSGIWGG